MRVTLYRTTELLITARADIYILHGCCVYIYTSICHLVTLKYDERHCTGLRAAIKIAYSTPSPIMHLLYVALREINVLDNSRPFSLMLSVEMILERHCTEPCPYTPRKSMILCSGGKNTNPPEYSSTIFFNRWRSIFYCCYKYVSMVVSLTRIGFYPLP